MIRDNKPLGFTLIEMMIAVAISSILITMSVPSLRSMVEKNKISTVTNEISNALFFVRSEALKRRMNVFMCVSNTNGSGCEADESLFDYAHGWLIYMDCNSNGNYDNSTLTCDLNNDGINDTAELLKVHEDLDTNLTVTGNGNYTSNIGYGMNGRVRGIGGSLTIDLLSIATGGVTAKKVVVSNTGRIRTQIVSP